MRPPLEFIPVHAPQGESEVSGASLGLRDVAVLLPGARSVSRRLAMQVSGAATADR
jgi:hypothetical protein